MDPSVRASVVPDPDRVRAWSNVQEVLAVRLDTIGDVLMTSPALRALDGKGRRRVTVLTSPSGVEAAELIPEVSDVVVYQAPWMKVPSARPDPAEDHRMIERLRARQFDAVVIFTVATQSPLPAALLCRLAGIPLRLAHCRERAYQLLSDQVPETETAAPARHEVRRQLDLVAAVGFTTDDERLSVRVPRVAHERAARLLHALGFDDGAVWFVAHPGGNAPSRRYNATKFARAIRLVGERTGNRAIVTGLAGERELVREVVDEAGGWAVGACGELDVGGLAALLSRSALLVSGNTGPVHVAAAVGTPVVDLYALTNPQHAPWQVPGLVLFHDVPCRNCLSSICPMGHHACLEAISPEAVAEAAVELLDDAHHV